MYIWFEKEDIMAFVAAGPVCAYHLSKHPIFLGLFPERAMFFQACECALCRYTVCCNLCAYAHIICQNTLFS